MARSSWGSKRQRSKGVWELRYTVNGKQQSKTFKGTAKQADAELARLRVLHEDAKAPCDASTTIGTFFWGDFIPECEQRVEVGSMARSTLSGYIRAYTASIEEPFADTPLGSLAYRDVQDLLLGMTRGKAQHAKSLLSIVMQRATDKGAIENNVMRRRFIMPTMTSGRERTKDVYSTKELEQIFEECRGEIWEGAFILGAFGGGQRAEVMGVKPHEADFAEDGAGDVWAVVPVNRGVHLLDGEVVVEEHAKNNAREDVMVIPPPYSLRLRQLVRAALKRGDEWLMDDGFGEPTDPEAMTRAYGSWLARSNHRYVPFGNLRNAYSTMLHAKGVPGDMVSKLMRHASPITDQRFYNRPGPEERIEVLRSEEHTSELQSPS